MDKKFSVMQLREYFHNLWIHDYHSDYVASRRVFNVSKRVRAAQRQRKVTRKAVDDSVPETVQEEADEAEEDADVTYHNTMDTADAMDMDEMEPADAEEADADADVDADVAQYEEDGWMTKEEEMHLFNAFAESSEEDEEDARDSADESSEEESSNDIDDEVQAELADQSAPVIAQFDESVMNGRHSLVNE